MHVSSIFVDTTITMHGRELVRMKENSKQHTVVGTDIEAVKEQARKSGLSYNEAKEWIAKTTGGRDTNIYSDTDPEAVKRKNMQSEKSDRK